MEIGENGVPGANAVRHAKKENRLENVNAISQRQSMVEKTVKGNPARQGLVTRKFVAQVSKRDANEIMYTTCKSAFIASSSFLTV